MSSHIVDVLADTSPIGHLDFDPPCDNERCDHTAVWILWRVRCCPTVPEFFVSCEPCRKHIWSMALGECTYCHVRKFIPARKAFYRIEPINERMRGGS